jgi:hypothetical protein
MEKIKAYEEVVEFIASGTSPDSVIAFSPSADVKKRVGDLIHLEKTKGLSPEEKSELDHYMTLEHLMRLAKAKARKYAADRQLY